jgi:hypothetical protein
MCQPTPAATSIHMHRLPYNIISADHTSTLAILLIGTEFDALDRARLARTNEATAARLRRPIHRHPVNWLGEGPKMHRIETPVSSLISISTLFWPLMHRSGKLKPIAFDKHCLQPLHMTSHPPLVQSNHFDFTDRIWCTRAGT